MRIGRRSSGWFIVAARLVGRSAELATTAAVCIATAAWANVCRSPRQMNNFGNGRIATSRHLILGSFADLAPFSLLMIRPPYGVCAASTRTSARRAGRAILVDAAGRLAFFVDRSWRSACAGDARPVGRRVRGIYFPLRYRGKALRASLIAC
jgi:hypothetical protein